MTTEYDLLPLRTSAQPSRRSTGGGGLHHAAVVALLTTVLSLAAGGALSPALAQEHTGDVLGDLIHIKRDATTGQPILQKR